MSIKSNQHSDFFQKVKWQTSKGVEMYCHCGPKGIWGPNGNGFACQDCAKKLPENSIERRLNADMPCCYCDNIAKEGIGYRLSGHPQIKETI